MDWMQWVLTFLGVIVGSGIIQFFVSRTDKKTEEARNEDIKTLKQEFAEGLKDREDTGRKRFEEHKLAIEKMDIEHKKDFQEVKEAIRLLTENDTKITTSIQSIADKQDVVADANVGMIHNTLIRFTDPVIERDCVTYEELATLDSLYIPYSKLGGNGECKRRYEDVNRLNKISKEEAINRDRAIAKRKAQELAGA